MITYVDEQLILPFHHENVVVLVALEAVTTCTQTYIYGKLNFCPSVMNEL